jgi:hypothetical protein
LRKIFPGLKVDPEQISDILKNEVLKREVIEGDKVKETELKIKKVMAKLSRPAKDKSDNKTIAAESTTEPAPLHIVPAEK